MQFRVIFSLVVAAGLLACGKEPAPAAPASRIATTPEAIAKLRHTIQVDGVPRTYVLHVPAAVRTRRQPVPLVMLLHGATDDGVYAYAAYGFPELAEKEGFIAVFPDGVSTLWDAFTSAQDGDSKDDIFLVALLAQLQRELPIDPRRIYLCGHSNGAMMAGVFGARHADQIAALGLVAGTAGWEKAGTRVTIPHPTRAIPVLIVHGMKDPNLPFDQPKPGVDWQIISPEKSAALWAREDGLGPAQTEILAGGRVRHVWYATPHGHAEVSAYFLTEGNHMWPGGRTMPGKSQTPAPDLATTETMWQFFKAHPLDAK